MRFARLFNTSPFAIATLSRSGTIESTNARFAGFLPAQQAAGPRDLASLIAPADRPKIETAFHNARSGAGETEPVDVALAGEAGRSARFFFVPSGTSERNDEAVIVYALETTDEKKLQEQLFNP